jgi:Tol biopolymer transport system component
MFLTIVLIAVVMISIQYGFNLNLSDILYKGRRFEPLKGKIVYRKNSEIYVMNRDGTNQTKLIGREIIDFPMRAPAVSPDGTRIAFSAGYYIEGGSNPRAEVAIYIFDLLSGTFRQVTPKGCYENPKWSPDGKWLVFQSGPFVEISPGQWWVKQWDIYKVNLETGEIKRLTEDGGEDPDWSPDGTKIAYKGKDGIYIMNSDGSNKTKLIGNQHLEGELKVIGNKTITVSGMIYGLCQPCWFPDGKRIAFVAWFDQTDIFLVNCDGSNLTLISWHEDEFIRAHAKDEWPRVSPDGKEIVFMSAYGGWNIYKIVLETGEIKRLTSDGGEYPSLSPL